MENNYKLTGVLYAVFRVGKKYKSMNEIKGFQKHMQREQYTPNADKEKTKDNSILIGNEDIYGTIYHHLDGVKFRKNTTYATDILLTASPEYFKGTNQDEKNLWIAENLKFINNKFGASCIYAVVHEDETTPHIHALISHKCTNKKGEPILANSRLFDGVDKLRKWQDDYSEYMAKFNLNRGVRFSRATHVRMKQFYNLTSNSINPNRLNDVVNNTYRCKLIKDQYVKVINTVNDLKSVLKEKKVSDEDSIDKRIEGIKTEIYWLSNFATANEKFYSEEKFMMQQEKVVKMISNIPQLDNKTIKNIIDDINLIKENIDKGGYRDYNEFYATVVGQQTLKFEVLETKKILSKLMKDKNNYTAEKEMLVNKLEEMKQNKDLYGQIINALSEYYCIPQASIQNIISYLKEDKVKQPTTKDFIKAKILEIKK